MHDSFGCMWGRGVTCIKDLGLDRGHLASWQMRLDDSLEAVLRSWGESGSIENEMKSMRELLRAEIFSNPSTECKVWCERVFSLAGIVPFEDVLFSVAQLYMKCIGDQIDSNIVKKILNLNPESSSTSEVWVQVALMRASAICREKLFGWGTDVAESYDDYPSLETIRNFYRANENCIAESSHLSAAFLETIEALVCVLGIKSFEFLDWFLSITDLMVATDCALIQHRVTSSILKIVKYLGNERELLLHIVCHVSQMSTHSKTKYVLTRNLLEIMNEAEWVQKLVRVTDHPVFLMAIIKDSSLGPVISDCLVTVLVNDSDGQSTSHFIKAVVHVFSNDKCMHLDRFLLPRIAKRAPRAIFNLLTYVQQTFSLINSANTSDPLSPLKNDGLISLYVCLWGAIHRSGTFSISDYTVHFCKAVDADLGVCGTKVTSLKLDIDIIQRALESHCFHTRMTAFYTLCRGFDQSVTVHPIVLRIISTFIIDSQLSSGTAARQQTVACVQHLLSGHLSRVYKLIRDGSASVKDDEECFQNFQTQFKSLIRSFDAAKYPRSYCHDEVYSVDNTYLGDEKKVSWASNDTTCQSLIIAEISHLIVFWSNLLSMCVTGIQYASEKLYFHKQNLLLRLLHMILQTLEAEICKVSDFCDDGILAGPALNFSGLSIAPVLEEKKIGAKMKTRKFPKHSELMKQFMGILLDSLRGNNSFARALLFMIASSGYESIQNYSKKVFEIVSPLYDESILLGYQKQAHSDLRNAKRPNVLEGASRILSVQLRQETITDMIDLLETESLRLSSDLLNHNRNIDELTKSPALGFLIGVTQVLENNFIDEERYYKIIRACKLICTSVVPFVSHPSPEGSSLFSIDESILVCDDDLEDVEDDDFLVKGGKSITVESEDKSFSAMSFCWRAIKTGSNLQLRAIEKLGILNSNSRLKSSLSVPAKLNCTKNSEYQLSVYEDTARHLIEMLMSIRHPGAFTSLPFPLMQVCRLSSQKSMILKLLEDSISRCLHHPEVQTTRRSAGLPFCIASLVTSMQCNLRGSNEALCFSIDSLNAYLDVRGGKLHEKDAIRTVHCLNIFRQLFRESALGDVIRPYLAIGFSTCFEAFRSQAWAVRNSAFMLFSSLMNRAFGICHEWERYEETCWPAGTVDKETNVCDLRVLKCEDLVDVVGKELLKFSDLSEFSAYPLLSFLQRIRLSAQTPIEKHVSFYLRAAKFCLHYLSSPIMKIRMMCARLLSRLHACNSTLREMIEESMFSIYKNGYKSLNRLHGVLILIYALEKKGITAYRELLNNIRCAFKQQECPLIMELINGQCDEHTTIVKAFLGKKMESTEVSEAEAIDQLNSRTIPVKEIEMHVSRLLRENLVLSNDICEAFESFWKLYDTAGDFRSTLVRLWTYRTSVADERIQTRIYYLALTDDDEEIREMASDGRFRKPEMSEKMCLSVPSAIRKLLESTDSLLISDLLKWKPEITGRMANRRSNLFTPQELNCFKDCDWELLVMNLETASKIN